MVPDPDLFQDCGPADGPMVLLLHGWPDTALVWKAQVETLTSHGYRCVTFTFPHFESETDSRGLNWRKRGYSMDEMADLIELKIRQIDPMNKGVAIVAHDFGSVFAFYALKKYPRICKAFVTIDIGNVHGLCIGEEAWSNVFSSVYNLMFYGFCYQFYLMGIFMVYMLPLFGRLLLVPFKGLVKLAGANMTVPSMFGYFYLHTQFLLELICRAFGQRWLPEHFTSDSDGQSFQAFPQCPTLFVFGANKPFMFHDSQWMGALEKRAKDGDGSGVVGLPTGHYPHRDMPEKSNTAILQFLNKIDTHRLAT